MLCHIFTFLCANTKVDIDKRAVCFTFFTEWQNKIAKTGLCHTGVHHRKFL